MCYLSAFTGKKKGNEIWFPLHTVDYVYKGQSETWIALWTLQLPALKYVNVQVYFSPSVFVGLD